MGRGWEVIVVGGGPGGALAAKKCAANGLKTLLLEKKKMPRDKCCTGMVMGTGIQDIIRKEFGEYPDHVVEETEYLYGHALYIPGVPAKTLDITTPTTRRKVLDTWMCNCAKDAGAELWDSSQVKQVREVGGKCKVSLLRAGEPVELESQFVIGMDGSNSAVRESLFPEYQSFQFIGFQECYDTKINILDKRFNIISTLREDFPLFYVTHRRGYMFLEGVAVGGQLKKTIARAKQYLVKNHAMQPDIKPVWRDQCVIYVDMYRDIEKKVFQLAKGNILIGGDAAGIIIPVTGEGIGAAVITGYDAANAVIQAKATGKAAGEIYLQAIDVRLEKYRAIDNYGRSVGLVLKNIGEAPKKEDVVGYSDAFLDAWKYSLTMSWW